MNKSDFSETIQNIPSVPNVSQPEYLALVRGILEKRQKYFGTPDLNPKSMESQIEDVPSDRMDWEDHSSGTSSSNTSDLHSKIKVTTLCPSFNLDKNQDVGGVGLLEKAVSRRGNVQCPRCTAGEPGHISHIAER